jgi:hypothetical protein
VKQIIAELNPVIRGWGNYFRTGTCRREFYQMDDFVFRRLVGWLKRRGGQRGQRKTTWTPAHFYGMGLYQLRGTVRYAAQATPPRLLLSCLRENRTHSLKGDYMETAACGLIPRHHLPMSPARLEIIGDPSHTSHSIGRRTAIPDKSDDACAPEVGMIRARAGRSLDCACRRILQPGKFKRGLTDGRQLVMPRPTRNPPPKRSSSTPAPTHQRPSPDLKRSRDARRRTVRDENELCGRG